MCLHLHISTTEQALPNGCHGYLESPALFGGYNYPSDSLPVARAGKPEADEVGKPCCLCVHDLLQPCTLMSHMHTQRGLV